MKHFIIAIITSWMATGAVASALTDMRTVYYNEYRSLMRYDHELSARTGEESKLPRLYTSDSYSVSAMKKKTAAFNKLKMSVISELNELNERTEARKGSSDSIALVVSDVAMSCDARDVKKGLSSRITLARGEVAKAKILKTGEIIPFIFREDFVLTSNLTNEQKVDPLFPTPIKFKISGTVLNNDQCEFVADVQFSSPIH